MLFSRYFNMTAEKLPDRSHRLGEPGARPACCDFPVFPPVRGPAEHGRTFRYFRYFRSALYRRQESPVMIFHRSKLGIRRPRRIKPGGRMSGSIGIFAPKVKSRWIFRYFNGYRRETALAGLWPRQAHHEYAAIIGANPCAIGIGGVSPGETI